MPIVIREFETMVDETLRRIVNANIGITNVSPGSVVRTLVESLMAELDVQNYTIGQVYNAMNIDTAIGSDLDAVVSILGITRKPATPAEAKVVFGRSDIYSTDIAIQYAQMVSTKQDSNNGNIYEFIVIDDDAKLEAGNLQTVVNVRSTDPGHIYLPVNSITIMNTPIIGIEYVTNIEVVNSGTDEETDDELRSRAKQALAGLGKGTESALRSALLTISGVIDAVVVDVSRGVGTADIVVITNEIPPSDTLKNSINEMIKATKSAGINVETIYPTIRLVDISVTLTDMLGNPIPENYIDIAGDAVVNHCNELSIGDVFILSQLERSIGNAINNINVDVVTVTPSANVIPTSTQVIRSGNITINGVVYNG